jgi:hypothetical protein
VITPPSSGRDESYECVFACGSSVHQKCSNYTLIILLFSLCKAMWIIDQLVTYSNPHLGALTCPFTLEMLQAKEHTSTPYPFVVFTFRFIVGFYQRVWGCVKLFNIKQSVFYWPKTPRSPKSFKTFCKRIWRK